jgi:hypothetical protein
VNGNADDTERAVARADELIDDATETMRTFCATFDATPSGRPGAIVLACDEHGRFAVVELSLGGTVGDLDRAVSRAITHALMFHRR